MTKVLGKFFSLLFNPMSLGFLISTLIAIFSGFYYLQYQDAEALESYPSIAEVNRLHNLTLDFRLRQRGPRPGSDKVVILTIDEKAIAKYGRWPWPRSILANIIDEVITLGAKTLSFDIIFSEEQDQVIKSLKSVENDLLKKIPSQKKKVAHFFLKESKKYNHDHVLSQTIKKHSEKLILGAVFDEVKYQPHAFQDYCIDQINLKNGYNDYWSENESYILASQDQTELNLPNPMGELISQHLARLDQQVLLDWKKSKQGIAVKGIMNKKTRNDLSEKMKRKNRDYCLRYLSKNDELRPIFDSQWSTISKESKIFSKMTFTEAEDLIKKNTLYNPIHQVGSFLLNIPSIQANTSTSGTFNANQDKDGSVRRTRLFTRSGSTLIPTLAFKTYMVNKDLYPNIQLSPHPREDVAVTKIVSKVELRNSDDKPEQVIPTDSSGQIPINYAGPEKMFAYLSAAELLEPGDTIRIEQRKLSKGGNWLEEVFEVNKKEFIKDKNFIFGATATGIYDLRVMPFQENFPGVETHANLLDNLLRNDYLRSSTNEEYLMPWAIFILGIIFSIIIANFGSIVGMVMTFASLAGVYFLDKLYFFPNGIVITILFPLFTILFLYSFLTFFKYLTEERKKKQLKGTFQKYVSPEIVNEILKDPSKLELGGIKQEMSVFFSDIRGFTTISEQLDPKALSDLLNHYLTPMTHIIFENSGTLDKYMGDAIMAFFGAPIASDGHAAQACRAALQQIEKLFELQKVYEEQGLPMLDVGIGINTGDMSVGNMGSETVRNYTVMGDAVNLGARLEGINKQYGTRIIISEFTCKHIKNKGFVYREIDWVKVKGKNEPVKIFELIGEGKQPLDVESCLEHFNQGFLLYHKMEWEKAIGQFNQALAINPEDPVSKLYIERCSNYIKTPPKKGWDGIFTMTTK